VTQLTDLQLAEVAAGAGFTDVGLELAIAVALAESGGRTDAVNTTGNHPASRDRGLWQINSYWHPEVTDPQAFNPQQCAAAAFRISSHGQDWRPWSTFNSGSYRAFVTRARRAAGLVAGVPTIRRLLLVANPYQVGADVAAVQRLVGLGSYSGALGVDSTYGPWTAQHVAQWQSAHGLNADGIFGPKSTAAAGWIWAG
jgi:peptidoglycan hydrolase-like protein with peptidoglycan-binding domain